jgi:hypothetical protein
VENLAISSIPLKIADQPIDKPQNIPQELFSLFFTAIITQSAHYEQFALGIQIKLNP